MQKIPQAQLQHVKDLYYKKRMNMREIASKLKVSIDATVYFMRKYSLPRRSYSEFNRLAFERKPLSFTKNKGKTLYDKEFLLAGAMLYWGEGAKGNEKLHSNTVDFVNSDPRMVAVFLRYLRHCYMIDEKRLRVLLYCYSNQNVKALMRFWSKVTRIPFQQFIKPYVRKDFSKTSRKTEHGTIHIRYSDKKLLNEINKMIEYYGDKFAPVA